MRAKKIFAAVSAVCVSIVLATSVFAQDDLDNLLNDLEGEVKKKPAEDAKPAEAKPAEVKPAEEKPAAPAPAPAPEVKPADEKPAAPAPAPAPEVKPADEKPAAPAPAPAPEVKPVDEKPAAPAPAPEEKPADEKPAGPTSEVDSLAQVPTAPAAPAEPTPAAPAPVAVAEPAPAAPAEEPAPAPAPEAPAPAPAAEAPAPAAEVPAPAVAEAAPAAAPAKPPTEEEKLLSDIQTIEELRRDSLKMHALKELEEARAARLRRDWDVAFVKFRLANEEFKMEAQSPEFQKECMEGMAEAKYEAAKQALKESNRELAAQYAEEALKLRHPHAGALLDGLKSEQVKDTETDITDIQHRRNDPEYKKDRDLIRKRLRLPATRRTAILSASV